MKLSFRLIDTTQFDLEVAPDSSVPALKRQIQQERSIPVEHQRIIYQGRVLKDDKHLTDYGLAEGSILHMVVNSQPPSSGSTHHNASSGGPNISGFGGMLPMGGMMLGAVQVEGNANDPNLSENIVNALTRAMQSFMTDASGSQRGSERSRSENFERGRSGDNSERGRSGERADERSGGRLGEGSAGANFEATHASSSLRQSMEQRLESLQQEVETIRVHLNHIVPLAPHASFTSQAGDTADLVAYTRLVRHLGPMLRMLEASLVASVPSLRSPVPAERADLLRTASALQQTSLALQSMANVIHLLIQQGGIGQPTATDTQAETPVEDDLILNQVQGKLFRDFRRSLGLWVSNIIYPNQFLNELVGLRSPELTLLTVAPFFRWFDLIFDEIDEEDFGMLVENVQEWLLGRTQQTIADLFHEELFSHHTDLRGEEIEFAHQLCSLVAQWLLAFREAGSDPRAFHRLLVQIFNDWVAAIIPTVRPNDLQYTLTLLFESLAAVFAPLLAKLASSHLPSPALSSSKRKTSEGSSDSSKKQK